MVSGLLTARPDAVSRLLLDFHSGSVTESNGLLFYVSYRPWWGGRDATLDGDHGRFTVQRTGDGGEGDTVIVDHRKRTLSVQGHWWYRGVHSIEPHDDGTRIVHRVYNIAEGAGGWLVPMMHFRQQAQMREGMLRLLASLRERLHCTTHLQR